MLTNKDIHYPIDLSNLPDTWIVTTVGEAIPDIRNGFSSGKHNSEGEGIPHLRPMNIDREGKIVLFEVKYVSSTYDLRALPGDVLFNNTNSPELVGKTAPLVDEGEWAFSNHMTRLRPPLGISHRFVAYQLHFLWTTGYFRYKCTQHVNQASISSQTLARSVPIIIPPSQEQLRIVAEIEKHFSRLDETASVLTRALVKLQEYSRAVLKQASEGTLVPNEAFLAVSEGRDYEAGEQLLARILQETRDRWEMAEAANMEAAGYLPLDNISKKTYREPESPAITISSLPKLPPGWIWASVDQVGNVTLGRQRSPQYQNGTHMRPYLRVANVFEDRIDTSDVLEMNFTPEEYKKYSLEVGDVLLNEGQSLELVGRAAMFRNEVPGACFQNTLIRFRAHPGVSPSFALIVFRNYLHTGRFQKIAKWSTNIAHLGAGRFAKLEFPLPPLTEQERIVTEVERCLSIADNQKLKIETVLKSILQLRYNLLMRAFTGKLVLQDPKDQSAELLLQEIHESTERLQQGKEVAKSSVTQRKNAMPLRQSLFDVLLKEGRLTPEDLLRASGIGESLIDEFFEELKREVLANRIEEEKSPDGKDVYLYIKEER